MEIHTVKKEDAIKALVKNSVETFSNAFKDRHEMEVDNPNGTINMKIHNVFISVLGKEIQYYTALVRSFDSSLGNMLEKLAMNIAELSFDVKRNVEGMLYPQQTKKIAELLEAYKRHAKKPSTKDCLQLRKTYSDKKTQGGDLDNKKARSEKEAILEQYAILSNNLDPKEEIRTYFATAYNRFGEDKPWKQERVKQFFAEEELMIGKDFWNFICQLDDGYEIVLKTYKENSYLIKKALEDIKKAYLN